MSETMVQKQVRLVLEQQCASAFTKFVAPLARRGYELTLLAFDFGDDQPGNVAFKTSLQRPPLIATVKALLERWQTGDAPDYDRSVQLLSPDGLKALGALIKEELPAGVGYAIINGRGATTIYIANGDRESMTEMLARELVPQWEREGAGGN